MIPCGRTSGWPPIRHSRPPWKIFRRSRRLFRGWRKRQHSRLFSRVSDRGRGTSSRTGLDVAKLEQEAKSVSAALRAFPQLHSSRVAYHLIYTTSYLLNSEGTKIRANHSLAAVEASLETESDDGMPLHNFLAVYRSRPDQLPAADAVRKDLEVAGEQLITLRVSPPAPDYDGPVFFEPPAAGSLLAADAGTSMSGARGPLATQSGFEQLMERWVDAANGQESWARAFCRRMSLSWMTQPQSSSADKICSGRMGWTKKA